MKRKEFELPSLHNFCYSLLTITKPDMDAHGEVYIVQVSWLPVTSECAPSTR